MKLHEAQQEIARAKARFKVVRAGRRFGKTIVKTETMLYKAVAKSVRLARSVKNRSVIFIAPTQKQARTIVWSTFKERLTTIGEFNEQRLEIQVPTEDGGKSTIFIGGYETRENYRGMPNVVHIEFDELDTMPEFFVAWQEIFRPMLIDTGGSAGFGGTPKKENPNLRRLETEYADDDEWAFFHFTTYDNPHVPPDEIEKAKKELDPQTFRQEIMADHVENEGALFRHGALVDMFTNTVDKTSDKYLIVDIADGGQDKTIFNFFQGLESYRIEQFARLNTEGIIAQIREYALEDSIPYSHIAVDAIGVGAGVASSSLLDGIVGFKSSYGAIRTDVDPVRLPGVHYRNEAPLTTEYANLRSQCVFILAQHVNDHKAACSVQDIRLKERIIEELSMYQDVSKGDGKRMATQKEDIKEVLGRSPDISDTFIMRMYFTIRKRMLPGQSEEFRRLLEQQEAMFMQNRKTVRSRGTK